MARDPGSVWAPLPEAGAPDGLTKNKFIVHSTGDNATAAAIRRYFAGSTPNESTFVVGWGPGDPTLQIMDSTDRADANMAASDEGISVEVVGDATKGYNAWQRSELIRLGQWARSAHPQILPQIIPSAAQNSAGYGWHVMFGAPGPWAGVAKECPGKQRIKELQADIFPAIFAGTDPGGFLMALSDDQQLQLYMAVMEANGATGRNNFAWLNDQMRAQFDDLRAMLRGGHDPESGKNNFHWLAEQVVAAVGSIPESQVSAVEQAIAKAVADEIDRRERERLGADADTPVEGVA